MTMHAPVSDELYREFLKTFHLLREPAGFVKSSLMTSPLVRQTLQRQPALLPYQALQAAFQDILTLLARENHPYADLLHGRFWEGKQVEEMLAAERPQLMSRRSFSNYQRAAIMAFAFLFLQAEALSEQSSTIEISPELNTLPTNPPTSLLLEDPSPAMQQKHPFHPYTDWRYWRLILLPLSFVGILSLGLLNLGLSASFSPNMTTATETLFEDDFETGANQWTADSNAWSIQTDAQGNHSYCVDTAGPYTDALAGSPAWGDYTLELDVKILKTAPHGSGNIFWRVSKQMIPLYEVGFAAEKLGESGMQLARESPGYTILDETFSRLPTNVWVHLRIEADGAQLKLFVGKATTPLLQAVDPNPIRQGGIGLSAGFAPGPHPGRWAVCFDNIRVTRIAHN